jgi:hypothetical protein
MVGLDQRGRRLAIGQLAEILGDRGSEPLAVRSAGRRGPFGRRPEGGSRGGVAQPFVDPSRHRDAADGDRTAVRYVIGLPKRLASIAGASAKAAVASDTTTREGRTVVIGRVKVEMRRSGGFAGRTTKVHLDTADMPPAEAARLIQLVTTVDLSRLNVARGAPSAGADLMRYDLVIENGVDRWEGTVSDPSIPNELRPLLQFLTAAAR